MADKLGKAGRWNRHKLRLIIDLHQDVGRAWREGQRTKLNVRQQNEGSRSGMAGRKGSLGCFGFGGLSEVAASTLDTSYNQLTVSKTRTAADH